MNSSIDEQLNEEVSFQLGEETSSRIPLANDEDGIFEESSLSREDNLSTSDAPHSDGEVVIAKSEDHSPAARTTPRKDNKPPGRVLAPKSFINSVRPPDSASRQPSQSFARRLTYLTAEVSPKQSLKFYIGPASNLHEYPGKSSQRTSKVQNHQINKGSTGHGMPLNSHRQVHDAEQNHLVASFDLQQQEILGSGNLSSNILQISKLEPDSTSPTTPNTDIVSPTQKASYGSNRVSFKAKMGRVTQSKEARNMDPGVAPAMTPRKSAYIRNIRQRATGRPSSKLSIVGGHIDIGGSTHETPYNYPGSKISNAVELGNLAFSTTNFQTTTLLGSAKVVGMSMPTSPFSGNRLSLPPRDAPSGSGKSSPFPTALLPNLVPQHLPNNAIKSVALVKTGGDDLYQLIDIDQRDFFRRFPEKNPRFAVLPTVLKSAAFKTTEDRHFPVQSVVSPRPPSSALRTVAI